MTEAEIMMRLNTIPRYKAPKGVGTVLGVPVKDLVIPEHLWVRIRHLHAGNSTKSERRRASFMTVVEVINIETGKVHGIWKASPRNGDTPNRARGLQVALGGAIIRAMAGDGTGIAWIGRKSGHWPEAANAARALQTAFGAPTRLVFDPAPARAPAREARKTTFGDEDLIVKMAEGVENEIQSALDPGQDVASGNAAEAARNLEHFDSGPVVRMSHSKLTAGQCLQAEALLNEKLQKKTTSMDWVLYDYMTRGRNVVGFIMLNPSIPESQL